MAAQRMTREERRRQLLNTAHDIVRTEGTDALTLVSLAERAGVSRPVTYEHFTTRGGLLLALYRAYDERLGRAIRDAVREHAETLEDVAAILAAAYVDGVLAAGPECERISAALSGSRETSDFRRASREFYVETFGRALAPFASTGQAPDPAPLIGALGATEALAQAAAEERLSRTAAVSAAAAALARAARL
ncbi:TetR/AcrR family transcriptional regulator [Streptomyces johnsoniae]|uniref:TetR/AcrR family transcriptional regulator n=1 Tax=Streptomyces johnsoniae TaxID=3075532 RepID=A0ABU2SB88_9ACTN|nr:TetR/AcrR family transcriptional regulator [Streptomyces sp. DSM 41886]MDT0446237.1 TetR/AcrR family transcriptional regulator [Streptomyces sp. DSM 41886]